MKILLNTLMKYLKLFENIEAREFPSNGNHLSNRERKILLNLVGEYLDYFNIRVEDHYYYTGYEVHRNGKFYYYNVFDTFGELRDYILSMYYIERDLGELSELLKTSKLDPSFDNNRIIKWAFVKRYKDIIKLLLDDKRVRDKLSEEEINRFTNILKFI